MSKEFDRLQSKGRLLAKALRHDPACIGVRLDENGWAVTFDVLAGASISAEELTAIVRDNDKQRFEFSPDRSRIRARQGHSVQVNAEPTRVTSFQGQLYHGTVERVVNSILERGILRGSRLFVHLSITTETAEAVGARRGAPVVLVVDAKRMIDDGVELFMSSNGVYLTEHVNPKYITEIRHPDGRRTVKN